MSQPECAVLHSGECHRLGGAVLQVSTPEPPALSHPGEQHSTLGQGLGTGEALNTRACCSAGGEGCTAPACVSANPRCSLGRLQVRLKDDLSCCSCSSCLHPCVGLTLWML